jgi:Uma2 family endonuclease
MRPTPGERHAAAATISSMKTLVPDPLPAEVEALLERRRKLGLDGRDEVWEGVYHVVPAPSHRHSTLAAQVKRLLAPLAHAAGLEVSDDFNLGDSKDDFRVPDGGLHRPGAAEMWHPTAALALEVLSPDDETWQKLPFYAAHRVDEVLIVDIDARAVRWLTLAGEEYQETDRSGLVALGPRELERLIDWP